MITFYAISLCLKLVKANKELEDKFRSRLTMLNKDGTLLMVPLEKKKVFNISFYVFPQD